MSVDILTHAYVPLHEIVPKKEVKELLEGLGVEKNKLPKIFLTDPVIKKIEAKAGDVIRISRKSRTAEETTYYRMVV